ncbi:hypothetical protein GCM10027563_38680 [Parasphingorhabdus pacifica]
MPIPVPASATIGPGTGKGGGSEAGGWFGSSGSGMGVVGGDCANAAGTLSPARASDTTAHAASRRTGRAVRRIRGPSLEYRAMCITPLDWVTISRVLGDALHLS